MSNMEEELDLSKIDTRKAMIEFLEGYALERNKELDQRKVRRGLLKSYLLETLDSPVPAEKRLANALQSAVSMGGSARSSRFLDNNSSK